MVVQPFSRKVDTRSVWGYRYLGHRLQVISVLGRISMPGRHGDLNWSNATVSKASVMVCADLMIDEGKEQST